MATDQRLPFGLSRSPKPGDLYTADIGEHAGHPIEFLSDEGLRFNILGEPLISRLVRCRTCLISWTYGVERDGN